MKQCFFLDRENTGTGIGKYSPTAFACVNFSLSGAVFLWQVPFFRLRDKSCKA